MIRYEALLLAVPSITNDEVKTVEGHIERVVKENKGSLISFEQWGKYRLAYPVKKNDYGVYFLARFEVENTGTIVNEIKNVCAVRLNDIVMRDMVTVLDETQSLEYQRPQSLEEIPVRAEGADFGGRSEGRQSNQGFEAQEDVEEFA